MASLEEARVRWELIQLKGESASDASDSTADETSSRSEDAAAPASDPDQIEFLVAPPNAADQELLAVKGDLSDARQVITAAVEDGYWIHGPGYFDALLGALRGRASNEYRGSQEPLRIVPPQTQAKLVAHADHAIAAKQRVVAAALKRVEEAAVLFAGERLAESRAGIVVSAVRYVREAGDELRAVRWLNVTEGSPGAYTFEFNESAGLDLVTGLFNLLRHHIEVTDKDAALADSKRKSGKDMQRIATDRWMMLRAADRENTPRRTILSTDYGLELMDARNPQRPDLVAQAEQRFPDPPAVSAANRDALEAAAALTAALVDEGAEHPIIYRIWSPALAAALYRLCSRRGNASATMKLFIPERRFRYAVAEALRSSFRAAESLANKVASDPSHVWKFPLLIEATMRQMNLADDDFIRVAAEHWIDQLAEQAEGTARALTRVSEVVMGAQLAVRFIPAPQVQVPANIALIAINTAIGGIHLIGDYFQETDAREGFRAFLNPSESFAASDGSYLGTLVGAAFVLFGIAGLSRATLSAPSRLELSFSFGVTATQEYSMLSSRNPDK